MRKIIQLFLSVLLTFSLCSYMHLNGNGVMKLGDVTYTYGSGQIKCESQVDIYENIVVLLRSMTPNTTINFVKINHQSEGKILVAMMKVSEETDLGVKEWTNFQELKILIDPLPVKKITFNGDPVYSKGKIKVIVDNDTSALNPADISLPEYTDL